MNSQFGLANIWTQGEIVTKTVALLLLVMSVASQITIIFKTLDLIRYKKIARRTRSFRNNEDFAAAVTKRDTGTTNPFR